VIEGRDIRAVVKRVLSLLLLLGALTGLFGQEAAYAAGPVFAPVAIVGKSSDCMTMMHDAPVPKQAPCNGLTLGCIAAMGCVVPLMVAPTPSVVVRKAYERPSYARSLPEALIGRALEPEPHPPSHLI
jgi:hypothetical protein